MTSSQLVSIGYEGRTVDELVRELVDRQVDVLVDVRLTPLSRKPGLSKSKLSAHLADVGIDYLHLKALGNPKHNREAFWQGRVADGCQLFDDLLSSPEPQSALETIARLTTNGVVAVLCFEREHGRCHRQVVTSRVIERIPANISPVVYA